MKRQFKPNNKVKHFENKAKRYLAIGKWHEQRYDSAKLNLNFLQERFDSKNKEHEQLYSQFHGLRNEYFEQKDELSKVNQEILHYQKRIDEQMIRFNKNENELIKEVMDLESKLDMKDKQLLGVSIWFTFYVAFDIVGYFI
ncbi:hypothetical protein CN514_00875 [Bacillus sp. AFS001701]|uniref:hypothetical protein n=1 Tax=Bacillus sp. AFS001701 TaxID=2033480 RepID=UPI000BF4638E|nr:hypothetical protein [Bacillus sp. AFS001701]PET77581.1 hypothetical protein CN514_00875 [Bacillus sp. AFS001701]